MHPQTRVDLMQKLLHPNGMQAISESACQRWKSLDDAAHGLTPGIVHRFQMDVEGYLGNRGQQTIEFKSSLYQLEIEVPRVLTQLKKAIREMSPRSLGNCKVSSDVVVIIVLRCGFFHGSFHPYLCARWKHFIKMVADELAPVFRAGQEPEVASFTNQQIYNCVNDTWKVFVNSDELQAARTRKVRKDRGTKRHREEDASSAPSGAPSGSSAAPSGAGTPAHILHFDADE